MIISLLFYFICLLNPVIENTKNTYKEPAIKDSLRIVYDVDIVYKYPYGEGNDDVLFIIPNRIQFKSAKGTVVSRNGHDFNTYYQDLYDYLYWKYYGLIEESVRLCASSFHHRGQKTGITGKILLSPVSSSKDFQIREKSLSRTLNRYYRGFRKSIATVTRIMNREYYSMDSLYVLINNGGEKGSLEISVIADDIRLAHSWFFRSSKKSLYPSCTSIDYNKAIAYIKHGSANHSQLFPISETVLVLTREGNSYRVVSKSRSNRSFLELLE